MIRVNPDQLKQNSRQINLVSNEITDAAKEIYDASSIKSGYPDFDGQIITICRSGRNQGIRQSEALSENSYDLHQRADKFQKADTASMERMKDALASIDLKNYTETAAKLIETQKNIEDENQNMFTSEEFLKAWEEYGCPPEGSDAYLAFMIQQFCDKDNPVMIIKNSKGEYCVLIAGTLTWSDDDIENCGLNNIHAWLGEHTGYEETILNLISDLVPAGATVHLVGHSQGGIIANNCVADLIDLGYNVSSITNFGAPPPYYSNLPANIQKRYYEARNDFTPKITRYLFMLQKKAIQETLEKMKLPIISQLPSVKQAIKNLEADIEAIDAIIARTESQLTKVEGYYPEGEVTIEKIEKLILSSDSSEINGYAAIIEAIKNNNLWGLLYTAHMPKTSYSIDATVRNNDSLFEFSNSSIELVGRAESKPYKKVSEEEKIDSTLEDENHVPNPWDQLF